MIAGGKMSRPFWGRAENDHWLPIESEMVSYIGCNNDPAPSTYRHSKELRKTGIEQQTIAVLALVLVETALVPQGIEDETSADSLGIGSLALRQGLHIVLPRSADNLPSLFVDVSPCCMQLLHQQGLRQCRRPPCQFR